ncbi:GntR family transcriptional regulator [Nonomuraea endophytica]|uniref:DNA-binding GntR family transcriptional regulator n=1 Tax=Nonomuraea endophytica TaxID=714136 RepID=A0A7W8EG89_9ACTN|nr:GntR family transcriptional regulator [Nonomuraea endophytica]MBB5077307.1 DNA-binding GntR family transcriptional regulator [Nonomuraea endophytica]
MRSSIPVYLRLARTLQERIDSGALSAGSRLPSEPELSTEFGVNRLTIRQAIAELDRAGSVEIRRGIGTFVRSPVTRVSIDVDPLSQRVDLGSMHAGLPAEGVDGAIERIVATATAANAPEDREAAAHLGRGPADVARIDTLIWIESEPWAISTYWLPSHLLPGRLPPEGNVVRSLGVALQYDWRAFSATAADIGDAEHLGVAIGSPLLVREGVSCDPDGAPVLFVRRRIQGDRIRFVLNFRR